MSDVQTTQVEAVNSTPTQELSGEEAQTTQVEAVKPTQEATEEKPLMTSEQLKDRLERERTKIRKELEEEAAKAAQRAKMEVQERLELEKQEAEEAKSKLQAEKDALSQQIKDLRQLTGKVSDADAALELVKPEHRNEDGSINFDSFFTRYSFLRPTPVTNLTQPSAKNTSEKPPNKMTDEEYYKFRIRKE